MVATPSPGAANPTSVVGTSATAPRSATPPATVSVAPQAAAVAPASPLAAAQIAARPASEEEEDNEESATPPPTAVGASASSNATGGQPSAPARFPSAGDLAEQSSTQTASVPAQASRPPAQQQSSLPPALLPPASPRALSGTDASGARVVIRATDESWVQVRDADRNPIMTRVLSRGDIYRVPNRPGLTLQAGNAGALEILVDGNLTPAIGPLGSVRRDVPLDPDRLRTGALTSDR